MDFSPRPADSPVPRLTAPARPKPYLRVALMAATLAVAFLAPARPVRAADAPGISDTEIDEIIHKECDPMFIAAGLNPRNLKIHLFVGPMNAMTFSGTEMGITTDLIEETENPNQLIGVMAHESGHAERGDPLRGQSEMMKAGMFPMLLSLGLGILAIAARAPDAGAALISSSSYFGALGALGYSREMESRADQAAITYLEKAGMSAKGIVDFFDNFRYEEVFEEARRYPYFQDHPISSDRIENLRRRAEEQKHYNQVDSPQALALHEIMKAKLLAYTQPPQVALIKYKESDKSFPARYARAIAYSELTETDHALRLIDDLLADYPNDPYLWQLKGQTLFGAGRVKEAEPAHRRAVELKPNAPELRTLLAQAIIAQDDKKRMDDALTQLHMAVAYDKDYSDAYRLMAEAYDAKGEPGEARLATAEERFTEGDKVQARIFALRARDLLIKDTPDWRRATDIVLTSNPTPDDLKAMAHG